MDQTALDELTESIRVRGILQPLLARPHPGTSGRYQIIAGERRWRAAAAAGLHEVPVLVRDMPDSEAASAALVENLQRQDLNAIEEAEGFHRLLTEFGLTQETLAQAVGKSRSHVANTLRLLNLPLLVQTELRSGTITAGHARALLALSDPEAGMRAVIARGLSVRQTEALATQQPAAREVNNTQPRDPDLVAVERELTSHLGLKVQLSQRGRGGSIRIEYADLDQLEALLAVLRR
jgi:ParB family chromosome partitioning protein